MTTDLNSNKKRGGLGRGIGALLPQSQSQYVKSQSTDSVQKVQTDSIRPNRYQPRREFDEKSLNELAESIKSYGILQPLIVRKLEDGNYELIAGERRLRAAKIVGLEFVPVIIREYTDAQMSEISIIENVQRENLNIIEEAQAYERLINEFGHTQEVVAAKIGRSRSHISNILRLLKLSPTVRALVAKGFLSIGQARPLLAIEDESIQVQAAEMILSEGLSVRKVEAFINELKTSGLLDTLTSNTEDNDFEKVDSESESVPSVPIENNSDEEIKKIDKFEKILVDTSDSSDKINNVDVQENQSQIDREVKQNKHIKNNTKVSSPFIHEAEEKLTRILGAKVKITSNKKSSKIQIDFYDDQDLSRIIEIFDKSIPAVSNDNYSEMKTKEEKIAALRKFSTSQNFTI